MTPKFAVWTARPLPPAPRPAHSYSAYGALAYDAANAIITRDDTLRLGFPHASDGSHGYKADVGH